MFRRETDINSEKWINPREWMSGLQNRNKSNLLIALGSAPPIVEELVPETDEARYAKNLIIKQVMSTGRWLGNMSGLLQLPGQLQNIAQQAQNRIKGRLEFELEQFFLPLKALARDVVFAYESFTTQYQAGSGLGGMIGGWVGSALGWYYLGPFGAALFGWIGQVGGALIGGWLEAGAKGELGGLIPGDPYSDWEQMAREGGYDGGMNPREGDGGMAPQRAFQDTYRSYRRKGRFVIIKMLDLERRLY